MLDAQVLRDLDAVFANVTTTAEHERPTKIEFNEYEADSIEDVLTFERPVHSLQFVNIDLILIINLTGVLALAPAAQPEIKKALDDIETILRPRVVPWSRRFNLTRVVGIPALATAVAAFWVFGLPALGVDATPWLGLAIELLILLVNAVLMQRQGNVLALTNLFPSDTRTDSFVRRWGIELGLLVGVLSIVVAVVIAVVDG